MNIPSLPFDLHNLRVCCYGNIYAIGGPVEIVTRIANIIVAYDCSRPVLLPAKAVAPEYAHDPGDTSPSFSTLNRRSVEVHTLKDTAPTGKGKVHKTHSAFAYVTADPDTFAQAFTILRRLAIPHTGNRASLRRSVKLAEGLALTDFEKIKRENFLGFNVGRNSFIGDASETSTTSADAEHDWQADTFTQGAAKAASETYKAA